MSEPRDETPPRVTPDEPFEASDEMRRKNLITAAIIMAIVFSFILLALSGVVRG